MDVHDSTAQEQRYTSPCQVKAVAEVSRAQLPRVLKDFFIVQSVNEHGGEGVEAWGQNISDYFSSISEQLKLVFGLGWRW